MQVFPKCGHPRTPENSTAAGSGKPRCKACKNAHARERSGGIAVTDCVEVASYRLLRALHREHPYVFAAAERAGRLAVRP